MNARIELIYKVQEFDFAITYSAIVMIVTMVIYVSMFTRFIPVLGTWTEIALRIQSLKMTFFFKSRAYSQKNLNEIQHKTKLIRSILF
jgi:hypothetical protein